jgi:Predicted membrane protein
LLHRLILGLAIIFLTVFIYASVIRPLFQPFDFLPVLIEGLPGNALMLMFFSLFHCIYTLGLGHTAVFFSISILISWFYEQLGVTTGLIFGAYYYSDMLGVKVGAVPLIIPAIWFMMIYPSYIIANLIDSGRPSGTTSTFYSIMRLSLISALVMTAWDLIVDPLLSSPAIAAWVWEEGGIYFGVPLHNFAGWILTTFTIYLAYRLFEKKVHIKPLGPMTKKIAALPLIAYGSMIVLNFLAGHIPELHLIGVTAMGLPLLIAAARLRNEKDYSAPAH